MLRCSRSSSDLLLRYFLDKRVNLLDPPRPRLELGRAFLVKGSDVTDLPLASVVDGEPVIEPDESHAGEVDEVHGKLSSKLSFDTGASISGAMLRALGLGEADPDVGGSLRSSGARNVRVGLKRLAIRRLNRETLARSLATCLIRKQLAAADGTHTFYVTVGTWAASDLDFRIEGEGEGYLGGNAALTKALTADGRLSARTGTLAETLVASSEPLVFGVELMRLGRKGDGLILVDHRPGSRMRGPEEGSAGRMDPVDYPSGELAQPELGDEAFISSTVAPIDGSA